ncbi:autoinducer binding domain-containing protein [Rhizobium sp. ZPR3]|uniref:Autoinducer binding domain-containing protein n=2 Tax=unclassified Rhizobium TaxID=2613769 RepID=A0AAU7SS98_9HYPH
MINVGTRFNTAFEIVDSINSSAMIDAALQELRLLYGVASLYYQALDIDGVDRTALPIYGIDISGWVERYLEQRYFDIDLIAKLGRVSNLPFDWATAGSQMPSIATHFSDAFGAGLGQRGMTIPIHDADGDSAILSFIVYIDDEIKWKVFRRGLKPELTLLGLYLHQKAKGQLVRNNTVVLSRQESHCLQLFADGDRPARIADRMGISVHTVRMHLRRAQHRLGARSKADAVAKGVSLGFIRARLTAACCFAAVFMSRLLQEVEIAFTSV